MNELSHQQSNDRSEVQRNELRLAIKLLNDRALYRSASWFFVHNLKNINEMKEIKITTNQIGLQKNWSVWRIKSLMLHKPSPQPQQQKTNPFQFRSVVQISLKKKRRTLRKQILFFWERVTLIWESIEEHLTCWETVEATKELFCSVTAFFWFFPKHIFIFFFILQQFSKNKIK